MGRKFAVLTSGGDAPGMNAAIRSIVRVARSKGHEVLGVQRGYQGLLSGDFRPLGPPRRLADPGEGRNVPAHGA